jgi:hypothetical protein
MTRVQLRKPLAVTRMKDGMVWMMYAYNSDDGRITLVHAKRQLEYLEGHVPATAWTVMTPDELLPKDTEGLR